MKVICPKNIIYKSGGCELLVAEAGVACGVSGDRGEIESSPLIL